MTTCPCGLQQAYLACCGCYLTQQATPKTAEALMRSRYSAYTLADTAYIKKTMMGKPLIGFNEIEAKKWAQSVTWLNLTVIRAYDDSTNHAIGFVEFVACYLDKNIVKRIHETSEFQQINGEWFYCDGKQITHSNQIIARNALCPCGSQRKFKNCHA